MKDQKQHWNNAHSVGQIDHYPHTAEVTDFAKEVLTIIKPNSRILELGCGASNDPAGFAQAGHTVIATDFSEVVISKNKEQFKDQTGIEFEVLDLNEPIAFEDNKFDVVYARLSLHYFPDIVTHKIFTEIQRVLRPNGYLCFLCKSTEDPKYGQGTEVAKDIFESKSGHLRHFFSEDYTRDLLSGKFEIEKLEMGRENFYGDDSAFIKVIAKAIK